MLFVAEPRGKADGGYDDGHVGGTHDALAQGRSGSAWRQRSYADSPLTSYVEMNNGKA